MKKVIGNEWVLGIVFGIGLLVASSDGDWFPWANIVGVVIFGSVGIIANYLRPAPWR